MAEQTADIYFKVAFTTRSRDYPIPLNDSMETIINNVKMWVKRDFNLENIELVEAGQRIAHGERSEDAPALIAESMTFKQKYENILPNLAFYIRQLPIVIEDDTEMDVVAEAVTEPNIEAADIDTNNIIEYASYSEDDTTDSEGIDV